MPTFFSSVGVFAIHIKNIQPPVMFCQKSVAAVFCGKSHYEDCHSVFQIAISIYKICSF